MSSVLGDSNYTRFFICVELNPFVVLCVSLLPDYKIVNIIISFLGVEKYLLTGGGSREGSSWK
jgi:hypothetical protein